MSIADNIEGGFTREYLEDGIARLKEEDGETYYGITFSD